MELQHHMSWFGVCDQAFWVFLLVHDPLLYQDILGLRLSLVYFFHRIMKMFYVRIYYQSVMSSVYFPPVVSVFGLAPSLPRFHVSLLLSPPFIFPVRLVPMCVLSSCVKCVSQSASQCVSYFILTVSRPVFSVFSVASPVWLCLFFPAMFLFPLSLITLCFLFVPCQVACISRSMFQVSMSRSHFP